MSAVETARLGRRLSQDSDPPIPFSGRYPVRPHLRPKDGWPLATEEDIRPDLLARFPRIVAEMNCVSNEFYEGAGRPGRGWAGWNSSRVFLEDALAMPWQGEA